MNTLRVDDLQAFFNDRQRNGNLKGKGGLSPKTLLNMRNMMHLAFTQAIRNRLVFDNPVEGVRIPKLVKTEMRVLNREEQDRLITAVRLAPEPAAESAKPESAEELPRMEQTPPPVTATPSRRGR